MNPNDPETVTLFIPCLMDTLYPQAARDLVVLLQKGGFRVDYPQDQTCCGQPAYNQGYFEPARKLARRFLETFRRSGVHRLPLRFLHGHGPEALSGTVGG